MATLTMYRGIPASGKSTAAAAEAGRTGAVVVTKDDIRAELERTGWVWSQKAERDVLAIRDSRIADALSSGANAISADTNFGLTHEIRLREIAEKCGADFATLEFRTPLHTCLARNAARTTPVPDHVIKGMAATSGWYNTPTTPVEVVRTSNSTLLPQAIICDLDGTAALFSHHRGPYDHMRCGNDAVNRPVYRVLQALCTGRSGTKLFYTSGRDDEARTETEHWLKRELFPPGTLLMRAHGDTRKDSHVKLEMYNTHIRDQYHVLLVLDDRDQVVEMWRALGLTCFQVAKGDF